MSPRLPVVEAKDLARVARSVGFVLDRQMGGILEDVDLAVFFERSRA